MTHLYNCRHAGDEYRITKFDSDLNPIEGSSYLLNIAECTCPVGSEPMCRHREMLPLFIERNAINTDWFYDYGRGGWVQCDMPEPIEVSIEVKEQLELSVALLPHKPVINPNARPRR